MKKTTLMIALLGALSMLPAFGQGYFIFSGPVQRVSWEDGSLISNDNTNCRVAFMWGSTSATPAVNTLDAATTSNSVPPLRPVAWNYILTDPNFQLAMNANNSSLAAVTAAANGAWNYGASFPVTGTSPGSYRVFVIGWDSSYATPQAAALANAPIGWSAYFTYNATAAIGTPPTFASSGLAPFTVWDIPEPSAFSLAGLAVLSALLRRRGQRRG